MHESTATGLPETLLKLARERGRPLPVIGAGLAKEAGVPLADDFGRLMAEEAGLPIKATDDLEAVVASLVKRDGPEAPDRVARAVLGRLPIRATRTLTVIASGCRGGHIVTTNYDGSIARSVEAAGLTPRSYDIHDANCLDLPGPDEVAIVHLHGAAEADGRLIFPGADMEALRSDEGFQRNASGLLARKNVLYLGFRFAQSERHLQDAVEVLAEAIQHAGRHMLLLETNDIAGRPEHIAALKNTKLVEIFPYEDPQHRLVHQAALLLAPQQAPLSQAITKVVGPAPAGYLPPRIFDAALEVDGEELDRRAMSVDYGWGDHATPIAQLAASPRILLLGAPGMGKTELLLALARSDELATVVVDCRDLAAMLRRGTGMERAVMAALVRGTAGNTKTQKPTPTLLDDASYRFAFDALDELGAEDRTAVVAALIRASARWPQHRWLIASRPNPECAPLATAGFTSTWLWPSTGWADEYLKGRGVPEHRLEALGRSNGLADLIGIPLYAAAAADRLLDPEGVLPDRPLDLLVDLQRQNAEHEAELRGGDGATAFANLQALAVGLQLRGRADATTTELAEIAGDDHADAEILRESLIRATLLTPADDGRVAFVRRTTQEALCAHALLEHDDVVTVLRKVAIATVAGQDTLRSDLHYVLDLVFENADQRVALRPLDPVRWARTVVSRGDEQEAGEALDLLLEWHRARDAFVSPWSDEQVRSTQNAVWTIGRHWPRVVEEREAVLLEDIAHGSAAVRHNATLAYAAAHDTSKDPGWLLAEIDRPVTAVDALRIARTWRDPRLHEPLLERLRDGRLSGDAAKVAALALVETAADDEARIAVARAADRHPGALRQALAEIVIALPRSVLVRELRTWPSDPTLWDFALDTALSVKVPWTAEEIEQLVLAFVEHVHSTTTLERNPAAVRVLREHAAQVIAVLRGIAETQLALDSVYVLLRALEPRDWTPELDGPLAHYLSQDRPADAQPSQRDRTFEQGIVEALESGGIDERHPELLDLRRASVPERLRPRLRELSEIWWPDAPLGDVSRFSEDGDAAAAAIAAAALGDVEVTRARWLELVGAPEHFEHVNHVWEWLADAYDPSWEPAVIETVATAQSHSLTAIVATVRPLSKRLVAAVGARLAELPLQRWWGNTVGLLRDRDEVEVLLELAAHELTPEQHERVDEDLAQLGVADAQVRALGRRLVAAHDGRVVETFHWREPIRDEQVIRLLGELFVALPREERGGGDVRSTVAGALSAARNPVAIDVLEAAAAHDERDWQLALYGTEQIRGALATEAVLARLPESPAAVAVTAVAAARVTP